MGEGKVPRANYPWWVKVSQWGVPGRGGLWACVAVALLAAVGLTIYGFRHARLFLVAAVAVLTALPYWLSIRWIDKNGSWDKDG